jgi:hypothetical protein
MASANSHVKTFVNHEDTQSSEIQILSEASNLLRHGRHPENGTNSQPWMAGPQVFIPN